MYYFSKGTHTVAVIKGKEEYDVLRQSCADMFDSINKIIKDGGIENIPIEFFLGGDYKESIGLQFTVQID